MVSPLRADYPFNVDKLLYRKMVVVNHVSSSDVKYIKNPIWTTDKSERKPNI